jgi:hypothetical protein
MQFLPDFSQNHAPDYVVAHERKQLKWFLGIALALLILTTGSDFVLGLYGKPTIPPAHNPLTQPASPSKNTPVSPMPVTTTDLKTYTNKTYGYSIRYPKEISYQEGINGDVDFYIPSSKSINQYKQVVVPRLTILYRGENTPKNAAVKELQNQKYKDIEINNAYGVQMVASTSVFDYYLRDKSNTLPVVRVMYDEFPNKASSTDQKKLLTIFTQMLTTFTYTLPLSPTTKIVSPTPLPIKPTVTQENRTMCPMDAKMCPDGKTYVGRSGPNCEFIACPK